MSIAISSRIARRATVAAVVVAAVGGAATGASAFASTSDTSARVFGPAHTDSAASAVRPAMKSVTAANPQGITKPAKAAKKSASAAKGYGDAPAAIDWKNSTLGIPSWDRNCPYDPITFADGYASAKDGNGRLRWELLQYQVVSGDVNSDGQKDAVIGVECAPLGDWSRSSFAVYAYKVVNGNPDLLGTVVPPSVQTVSYKMRGHDVAVTARMERDGTESKNFVLRYTPNGFQEITGKGAYLYDWTGKPLEMPFKAGSVDIDNGAVCKKVSTGFQHYDASHRRGEQRVEGIVYNVGARSFGDVNHDGVVDALVQVGCYDPAKSGTGTWLYAYTVKNGVAKPLGFVTTEDGKDGFTHYSAEIKNGVITGKQNPGTSDIEVARTFTWTGHGFAGTPALPGFPNVDLAP
jgi:hypothetical protein